MTMKQRRCSPDDLLLRRVDDYPFYITKYSMKFCKPSASKFDNLF